jgi:hypothetical protein
MEYKYTLCDFSSITQDQRLLSYGVIFDHSTQKIYLSRTSPEWYRELAARHEYLCQGGDGHLCNDPNHCREVEEGIVDSIRDEELKKQYVTARIEMFKAVIQSDPKSPKLAMFLNTLEYLEEGECFNK